MADAVGEVAAEPVTENATDAAVGEIETQTGEPPAETPSVAPEPTVTGANVIGIQKIQNIKVRVQAVLGGISLSVSELANLKQGELLSLDTHVGDGIDILANGQLVARGMYEEATGECDKLIEMCELLGENYDGYLSNALKKKKEFADIDFTQEVQIDEDSAKLAK